MARRSWFDGVSGQADFDAYVEEMASWKRALEDGVVTQEEVQQQSERVEAMLRALEPLLSDELHERLTQVFYELAVLYGMERLADATGKQERK